MGKELIILYIGVVVESQIITAYVRSNEIPVLLWSFVLYPYISLYFEYPLWVNGTYF